MSDTSTNRFIANGTTAERTAFTPNPGTPTPTPAQGYIWWDTDTQTGWAYDFGLADWVELAAPPSVARSITFAIDGGGSALTTGVKADIYVPYACTITAVTMLADQSGSVVVDIWKDTYANYPPVVGDSITASAKPTITTAIKSQDTTLTGWTTSVAAGNTLRFNVDSATTITRLALTLTVTV